MKVKLLLIFSLPGFTGWPLNLFQQEIISGVSMAWTVYFMASNSVLLITLGYRVFANILTCAALITLPLIFTGSALSYFLYITGLGDLSSIYDYSSHYIRLCLTTLTVIPLAIGIVYSIPFYKIEQNMLKNRGVSKIEKILLMFLRVFNHIIYYVIPNILEVVREEAWRDRWLSASNPDYNCPGNRTRLKTRLRFMMHDMIQIGIEGICSSIEYIWLWAIEISQLPGKEKNFDENH